MLILLRRYSFIPHVARVTSDIKVLDIVRLLLSNLEGEFLTFAKIVWDILFSCAFIATSSPQSLPLLAILPPYDSRQSGLASYTAILSARSDIRNPARK